MSNTYRLPPNPGSAADQSFNKPDNGSGMIKPTDEFLKTPQEPMQFINPHRTIPLSIVPTEAQKYWVLNIPAIGRTSPIKGPSDVYDIPHFALMLYARSVKKIIDDRNTMASKRRYDDMDLLPDDILEVVKQYRYIGTLFRQGMPNGRTGTELHNYRKPNYNEVVAPFSVAENISMLNVFSFNEEIKANSYGWILFKEVAMNKVVPPVFPEGSIGQTIPSENCAPEERCMVMIFVVTEDHKPPRRAPVEFLRKCNKTLDLEPPKDCRTFKRFIPDHEYKKDASGVFELDKDGKKVIEKKNWRFEYPDAFVTCLGKITRQYEGKRTPKDIVTENIIIPCIDDIKRGGAPIEIYLPACRRNVY